jgi:hypothetical protein
MVVTALGTAVYNSTDTYFATLKIIAEWAPVITVIAATIGFIPLIFSRMMEYLNDAPTARMDAGIESV